MPEKMKPVDHGPDDPQEDSPVVWFVVLERARLSGQRDLINRALGELRRLGVRVTFTPQHKAAGHACA